LPLARPSFLEPRQFTWPDAHLARRGRLVRAAIQDGIGGEQQRPEREEMKERFLEQTLHWAGGVVWNRPAIPSPDSRSSVRPLTRQPDVPPREVRNRVSFSIASGGPAMRVPMSGPNLSVAPFKV